MREAYRVLDANFNRAREALRTIEDCGRFILNDPAITAMAKHFRSDLKGLLDALPHEKMITSRDNAGDLGKTLTTPVERQRDSIEDVVTAACKRLTEALRTLEEYSKIVAVETAIELERMRYDAYTLEQRVTTRLLVARRFGQVRLYALLSSKLCRGGSLRDVARQALAGGADAIQLREKPADTPDNIYLAYAAELRELTDEMGKLLIINDRPDIAAMVGADGLHLGQDDLPMTESRRLLRPGAFIGRSCHRLTQARDAINEGADYVALGPMFTSQTKDRPPVGPGLLDELAEAFSTIPLPIVAIGGITAKNVAEVLDRGATSVAICGAINAAENPKEAAQAIRTVIDEHLAGQETA